MHYTKCSQGYGMSKTYTTFKLAVSSLFIKLATQWDKPIAMQAIWQSLCTLNITTLQWKGTWNVYSKNNVKKVMQCAWLRWVISLQAWTEVPMMTGKLLSKYDQPFHCQDRDDLHDWRPTSPVNPKYVYSFCPFQLLLTACEPTLVKKISVGVSRHICRGHVSKYNLQHFFLWQMECMFLYPCRFAFLSRSLSSAGMASQHITCKFYLTAE